VAAARAAGLDAVAVTDHCTGAGFAAIVQAVRESNAPLTVFPGVELTVAPGVHLLMLFDCDRDGDAAVGLLSACGIGDRELGDPEACGMCSVLEALERAVQRGALSIAAHACDVRGLLKECSPGVPLQHIITSRWLHAVEVSAVEPELMAYADNTKDGYVRRVPLPILTGSDAHRLSEIGTRPTWIKMTRPALSGLRLALQDGQRLSVRNAYDVAADPNQHAELVIEELEVTGARYVGRPEPFRLRLNPWLNAIIGGRGTGKSTLLEFLRLALRREGELDALPGELRSEFAKYGTVAVERNDPGLLTPGAQLAVTYRKGDARFRVQWAPGGGMDPILEQGVDGEWTVAQGDVRGRFPVRLFSQKQIFALASRPLALLRVIDEAPEVGYLAWEERWTAEEAHYLALRAQIREIEVRLSEENRYRGELDDTERQIRVFEAAGHAGVLQSYQARVRQQRAIESWGETWASIGGKLRGVAEDVRPAMLDPVVFDQADPADSDLLARAEQLATRLVGMANELTTMAEVADQLHLAWEEDLASSAWKTQLDTALGAYAELGDRLGAEGIADPGQYGHLVQQKHALEERLAIIADTRTTVAMLKQEAVESLGRLADLRRQVTGLRVHFLESVLSDNPYVRINVLPFMAADSGAAEFRRLLQREGGGFERDIGAPMGEGILGRLFPGEPSADLDALTVEAHLVEEKARLRSVASGTSCEGIRDQRFVTHMAGLPPEAFDRLDCWFPEDSLEVLYSPVPGRGEFRRVEEGSPGQRTAALLAFLLSYGQEPIVLDQPEDDLDNHLISGLIVTQLREMKQRRQVVVVTHNPNIVVNGDAELVVALDVRSGQTCKVCEGGLQEQEVRDEICRLMEGGREAFEQRYLRIAGEP